MIVRHSFAIRWLGWGVLLLVSTLVLRHARDGIDQVHAVLTLLLVVIGGSVSGGRALGFTLAVVSFALIDYYFQPPFDLLSIDKPLDGVVLIAFVATAGVTTHLLTRARQEAQGARERASEVESLSRLGATTLRYAEPEEALGAVASLVREAIGAAACAIFQWDETTGLRIASLSVNDPTSPPPSNAEIHAASGAAELGCPVTLAPDGSRVRHDDVHFANDADVMQTHILALPLHAEQRTIGALWVRGAPELALDAPRRRLLAALGYYAALGIERMRLVGEAAHSQALREASRAKDQVLASVSHDLRTPLTTIKVLAQGAQSRGEPSAPAIVEQADRLARMVSDLLELSRIRAGNAAVAPEVNTADDIVGAALRQVEGGRGDRIIVPHVDTNSPVLVGLFDFVHTLRILGNLLDNSLRHAPPGGVIDLWATRECDQLVFTVADRGAGVDPAERERIFEAFYRPVGATGDAGHAGLGLSIARTLAELQGGTLSYSTREGGGSLFTLRLPAADLDESAGQEPA